MVPPPPSEALPSETLPTAAASPSPNNPGAMGFFVSPPPEEAYARELQGEEPVEAEQEEGGAKTEAEVEQSEPTP